MSKVLTKEIESAKKAKRKAVPKRVKPGCPAEAFGWIPGGVMAIKSPLEKVQQATDILFKESPGVLSDFAILKMLNSDPWTLAKCLPFPQLGTEFSRILRTQVVYLECISPSHPDEFSSYSIYDKGQTIERFEIIENSPELERFLQDCDAVDFSITKCLCQIVSKTGDHKVTFESRLIETTEQAIAKKIKFIDQRFKELGICLPAKLV